VHHDSSPSSTTTETVDVKCRKQDANDEENPEE